MLNDPTSDEHANDVISLVYKEQVATTHDEDTGLECLNVES